MNRLMLGAVLTAGLLVGGAGLATATTASAATAVSAAVGEPSAPVTITLSPEQVANLCEKRLPKIEKRATRLLDRINGGADVRGSAEWLKARAAKERDAGRETSAELLDERADRRLGKVDKLNQVKQWAADFRAEHCAAK